MTREPALADIIHELWRARLFLLAGIFAGLLGGAVFLALAVPQYRGAMLVSPTTRSGTPDISALFPNNASFAMDYVRQSFGPGDSSDFMRFETILREPSVARLLLEDERIGAALEKAKRFTFETTATADTPEKLSAWLQDNVRTEPVGETRLKRIAILHPDRDFAVYLLQRLYALSDGIIRGEMEDRTEKRIAYLKTTLDRTSHPEHRRILTQLLMDQEQISMILAVNEPFAASVAEPPSSSPRPWWPRRPVVLAIFTLAGMAAGYLAALVMRKAKP